MSINGGRLTNWFRDLLQTCAFILFFVIKLKNFPEINVTLLYFIHKKQYILNITEKYKK